MHEVYLNGLRLVPGIDYYGTKQSISFSNAPQSGDRIQVTSGVGNNGAYVQIFQGDGSTYLFKLDTKFGSEVEIQDLVRDLWNYKHLPAVAEQLNQLKVILELVKQDDTIC